MAEIHSHITKRKSKGQDLFIKHQFDEFADKGETNFVVGWVNNYPKHYLVLSSGRMISNLDIVSATKTYILK